MDSSQPIIVKRVRKGGHGHHGGAWKVAFADFATAMMAFFLVLYLSAAATQEQKEAVAGYFTNPTAFQSGTSDSAIDFGGRARVTEFDSPTDTDSPPPIFQIKQDEVETMAAAIERQKLEELMEDIQQQISQSATLSEFKDQLLLDITEEGLRIQIVDASQRPMFDRGDAELKPYFQEILYEIALLVSAVRNKVSISGHTDASPFGSRLDYSNWELSADRANAARRTLVQGGLPGERIARVVGLASSVLYDEQNPLNPVNRRISIIVLNRQAQEGIEGNEQAEQPDFSKRIVQDIDAMIQEQSEIPQFNPEIDLPVDEPDERSEGGLEW